MAALAARAESTLRPTVSSLHPCVAPETRVMRAVRITVAGTVLRYCTKFTKRTLHHGLDRVSRSDWVTGIENRPRTYCSEEYLCFSAAPEIHVFEYTCDSDLLATERISNFSISWNRDILGKCVCYTFTARRL